MDWQGANRSVRKPREAVGREYLGLERNVRLVFEGEDDH
jgi:hypothetical protein